MRLLGLLLLPLIALACKAGVTSTASSHYVLRVDQMLDRTTMRSPSDPITDASFKPHPPEDRYELVVSADTLTVVPLADAARTKIEGTRVPSPPGEKRFDLQRGTFAGGTLVIRGERGELTIFGSGVPVISIERGTLVRR